MVLHEKVESEQPKQFPFVLFPDSQVFFRLNTIKACQSVVTHHVARLPVTANLILIAFPRIKRLLAKVEATKVFFLQAFLERSFIYVPCAHLRFKAYIYLSFI